LHRAKADTKALGVRVGLLKAQQHSAAVSCRSAVVSSAMMAPRLVGLTAAQNLDKVGRRHFNQAIDIPNRWSMYRTEGPPDRSAIA
jgi:hypothetical protein